jgi:hypothetical protein
MGRWATLVAASVIAALPARALADGRVVLLPFENASRRSTARAAIMPAVQAELEVKGYEVVSGVSVETFLRSRRVRFLDSLAAPAARELAATLEANAVVVGSILSYDPSARDPLVTVAMRVVSPEGRVVWNNLVTLASSMTGGAFGRGKLEKIEDVARRAVSDLLATLPRPELLSEPRAGGERARAAPHVYRARELVGQHLDICVLPLQNLTLSRDAPRILESVLQHRIAARSDMSPVQPGDLRAAIVKGKLRAPAVLSLDQLAQLSELVGTPLFLRGTILAYGGPDPSGAAAPVELYLTLVDARSGRIMWSGLHRRSGSDYEGFLRFGAVQDDATLASRVVAELLEAFTRPPTELERP